MNKLMAELKKIEDDNLGRMLQLTRKQNESIIIGDDIKITVLNDPQGQVRLGIEAPDDLKIWREEIYDQLKECEGK